MTVSSTRGGKTAPKIIFNYFSNNLLLEPLFQEIRGFGQLFRKEKEGKKEGLLPKSASKIVLKAIIKLESLRTIVFG